MNVEFVGNLFCLGYNDLMPCPHQIARICMRTYWLLRIHGCAEYASADLGAWRACCPEVDVEGIVGHMYFVLDHVAHLSDDGCDMICGGV